MEIDMGEKERVSPPAWAQQKGRRAFLARHL
jgi:hypothetical protein